MSKGGLWCTWGRSYIVSPSTSGSLRAVRCAQAFSSEGPSHHRRQGAGLWPSVSCRVADGPTAARGADRSPLHKVPGSSSPDGPGVHTVRVARSSIGHPSARGPRDPDGASPAWGTPRRSPFAELPASVASGSASSGLGGHSARRRCGHRDSRVTWSWDGPVSRINEIMERESAPVGFGVDCNDKWS